MKIKIRTYTDINYPNMTRRIKFVRTLPRFLQGWHLNSKAITEIDLWELENGHIIQIPRDAWSLLGIRYFDIDT